MGDARHDQVADKAAAVPGVRGRLRASHADREQVIDVLKVAFVQGRMGKDEFDARVDQTLTSRTHAELAALTADIPAVPPPPRTIPPSHRTARARARSPMCSCIKTSASAIMAAVVLSALRLGLTWPETALMTVFALGFCVIVAGVVALPIAGVLMLESRHRKRSGG